MDFIIAMFRMFTGGRANVMRATRSSMMNRMSLFILSKPSGLQLYVISPLTYLILHCARAFAKLLRLASGLMNLTKHVNTSVR